MEKRRLWYGIFAILILNLVLLSSCSQSKQPVSQEDLIYFIMTDRFYNGDTSNDEFFDVNPDSPTTYHGGDLRGIIEKLDYIESLGATAIWITPIVDNQNNGYHGYWAVDFYAVDEHLGTMEDMQELVKACHKRHIKVIMDYVVNHTGYNSRWNKEQPEWFNERTDIIDWSNQEQVEKGWLADLPDFNFDNPDVRQYFIDNALWWIEQTDIDGIRLDTVKHVPIDYWEGFSEVIKKEYPNFYLMGEVWHNQTSYLANYQNAGLDGITNYALYEGIRDAFSMQGVYNLCSAIRNEDTFSVPELNTIFIDNHDNTRFMSHATVDKIKQTEQAIAFIMTYPAVPVIYYGTEIAMEGGRDPDNRRDMNWDSVENNEMLAAYTRLVRLRQEIHAKQMTEFELINYDRYYLAYRIRNDEDEVIIIMNTANNNKEIPLSLNHSTYYEYLFDGDENIVHESAQNEYIFDLNPLETKIIKNYK